MRATHFETYKGIAIAIATAQDGDAWSASAIYTPPGQNEVRVEPAPRVHSTEDEARAAALRAAVESIDRRVRASIGKP